MGAPTSALAPRDSKDLVELIAGSEEPLEPMGGGSKRAIGRPVEARPLALGALAGISSYEPSELVLTARAATPLTDIERVLGEHGQRLAFEPPDFGPLLGGELPQTLGGVLASNLAGSRRVSAGAARDHFLGFAAVNGRGELFKAGGRVVKNVTGYDLPKLLAGSWGTLAVLTEVTVRVAPVPELDRTLVLATGGADDATSLLGAALGSAYDVSAAGYDPARGCLLRVEGFARAVEARAAALCAALGREPTAVLDGLASFECWRAHASGAALATLPVVWRVSVAPTDAPRVLERLVPARYLLDWGGGLLLAGFATVDAARVRGAFSSGHATLIKAPAAARAATPIFQPPSSGAAAAAAQLKRAFDPRGILNPGRMD